LGYEIFEVPRFVRSRFEAVIQEVIDGASCGLASARDLYRED
jgi:hypothetical protein